MVESRAKMPCMIPEHTRNEAPANFGLRPGTVWSHVRKGFLFTALASVYSEKPRAAPARFQAARQRREIRRCDQGWFAVWNTPGVRFRVNVKGKIIRKVPQFSAAADFFKGMAARMATLTGGIGKGSKWLLDKIVGALAATGVNPNFLTFLGLVVNFAAAATFAVGHFFTGALIIFFAGFLDMLDGQVARRQNRVTAFGAFYDSTLDRYADMALYMGLLVFYSVSGRTPYVVLAAVATAGSVMVSYARARAESLIPLCKVGFMERPERLVLLIIGGVFNRMAAVLWVIAVVSTITVIHRIVYTWQETRAGRVLPGIRLSL
jgi:CDP-diacylglycerol--glycerol-3-phosphate 3-phosphatidyltransferase